MQVNMGTTDKAIRITVAVVLAAMYFTKSISGIWGIIGLVVAGIFLLTSLISFCPMYTIFGWSTHKGAPKP